MTKHPDRSAAAGERRHSMFDVAIGDAGTTLLFAVFVAWPLAAPAAATWFHQTVECAVASDCEGLMMEKRR